MARAPGSESTTDGGIGNRSAALAELRARVRALEGLGMAAGGMRPLGLDAVDTHLPDGGLPLACLHEIVDAGDGVGTGFAAALLARLDGPVLWLARSGDLYAPGLVPYGLGPERLLLMTGLRDAELLWALEEGLRARALAGVLAEIERLTPTAARRLQLAAESGRTTGFLLRSTSAVAAPSAVTRWRPTALPADTDGEPGVGPTRWRLELERCRGGVPACWELRWNGDGSWRIAEPLERPLFLPKARHA